MSLLTAIDTFPARVPLETLVVPNFSVTVLKESSDELRYLDIEMAGGETYFDLFYCLAPLLDCALQ